MCRIAARIYGRRGGALSEFQERAGAPPGQPRRIRRTQFTYYASKAYVISLTEAAAWENAGKGVRLTVLAPGPVNTSFHEAMGAESSFYRQLLPALSPERTANSAYSGFVLGRCLIVPGVINTFMAVALRILPHTLLLPLVGWLLRPREELQNEKPNDGEH